MLLRAKSVDAFNAIFEKNVRGRLGGFKDKLTIKSYRWGIDEGLYYESDSFVERSGLAESRRPTERLMNKLFLPVKRLVEAPKICARSQVSVLTRLCRALVRSMELSSNSEHLGMRSW